jgi:hypothetical protein
VTEVRALVRRPHPLAFATALQQKRAGCELFGGIVGTRL